MTIDPHDEHGALLRRALHAEVDSIVPSGDGLERIRARVEKRRGRRAFLATWWLKPVLAAFGAIAVAGSASVAAPLLQQVGDTALGHRPTGPQASGAQVPGHGAPQGAASTSARTSPRSTHPPEASAAPTKTDLPNLAVECGARAGQDKAPEPGTAKPPTSKPSTAKASASATPPASDKPSAGPTCTPESSPSATATPTTSPSSMCPDASGCPQQSPSSEPPASPSP